MAKYRNNKRLNNFFVKSKNDTILTPNSKNSQSLSNNNAFFIQSTTSSDKNITKKEKKPFDKKKWRMQKYSIKHKVQNWEERRKKAILRDYHKQNKHENKQTKLDVNKIYQENDNDGDDNDVAATLQGLDHQVDKPAPEIFLEEKKMSKREEFLERKAKKEEILRKYKKEKIEKYKRLNKKTKRGQPVMKERLEDLLDKIKKTVGRSD